MVSLGSMLLKGLSEIDLNVSLILYSKDGDKYKS